MKPHIHSSISVRKWGGCPSDYQEIHDFLDISKMASADMRHRMLLHHSLGCYILEKCFGLTITNSDGKEVSVRDIAEGHILDDLGCIPSFDKWIQEMSMQSWMGQPSITTKTFTLDQLAEGLVPETKNNYCD